MARERSPQREQHLADGLFQSKEAALEAAVDALRARYEQLPSVPAEHLELVEQGIASARAGRCRELTDADWESLRQRARDVASPKPPSSD